MHVTGAWSAVGAVITALIAADIFYHYQTTKSLAGTGSKFALSESRLLAGRS